MFFLLIIWGDTSPEVKGPYRSDVERLAIARRHRARSGDRDGLFRLNLYPLARVGRRVDVQPFGGGELVPDVELSFRRRAKLGRRFVSA